MIAKPKDPLSWTMSQSNSPLPKPAPAFPASWMVEYDEPLADFLLWNREPPAPDNRYRKQFTANWDRCWCIGYFKPGPEGVAICPTFIRHYFGVQGCIIPIAALPSFETPAIVFVLAGPADADGKKIFYAYIHNDHHLEHIQLCHVGRFASIGEFYRTSCVDGWSGPGIVPVAEGEEAAKQELAKFGYWLEGEG